MTRPKSLEIFYVPTPIQFVYGINAPALVFKLLALPLHWTNHAPIWIGHFNLEDLSFLVGVIVLWYSIGTVLDRLRSHHLPSPLNIWRLCRALVLIALGVFLLGGGLDGLSKPWTRLHNPGVLTEQIFFVAWGIVLVLAPSVQVVRVLRRKRPVAQTTAG